MDSNIAFLAQHLGTIWPDSLAKQIGKPSWSQWYYVKWHQVKVASSNEAVLDCLCFPKNWKSRENRYLISRGIYIFPWTKQQLFKDRRKKIWNMKMKSHKQTKLKIKNLCVRVFRGLQSISLKIIYINIYKIFLYIYLFVCLLYTAFWCSFKTCQYCFLLFSI